MVKLSTACFGLTTVLTGTGWGVENLMFKIVCHVMAYSEKQSPFASYCLVNNKQFKSIIWG